MGGRKIQFANDYYYHIYNRGVDKRKIFLNDFDYIRFLESLRDFNDIESVGGIYLKKIRDRRFGGTTSKKEPLVRILCYCLMPNHYHFLLEQLENNGITGFMRRIGTGYSRYFNDKYERSGTLFESRFQAVLVERNEQLEHLLRYIHLNPLDVLEPNWRESGIKDVNKAEKFLEKYRWSSHLAYISDRPSKIIDKGIFKELFKRQKQFINLEHKINN